MGRGRRRSPRSVSRGPDAARGAGAVCSVESLEGRRLLSAGVVKDLNVVPVGANPGQMAASNGALFFNWGGSLWKSNGTEAGTAQVTNAVAGVYPVRLIVRGNHVEHWLNGQKIVEYELHSPEWKAAVQKSKFRDVAGYGQERKGHLVLQDHGDLVWYRNIKIKPLSKPE